MTNKAQSLTCNWLKTHLKGEEAQRLFAQDTAMLVVTGAIVDAMERMNITRAELAERIGKSKGFVSQVLSGSRNMTLKTLGDLLWACGLQLKGLEFRGLGEMSIPLHLLNELLDQEPVPVQAHDQGEAGEQSFEVLLGESHREAIAA